MKTALHISILLLLLAGCEDQGSQPPGWLLPYEQWKISGLQNYTIDQTMICYCITGGQTMRLVVRSGLMTSVTRLSDSAQMSPPISSYYRTVDSLFGIIRNPGSDSIVVTYNSQYGYPERLDINPQSHPVDGGVIYETSNLRVP